MKYSAAIYLAHLVKNLPEIFDREKQKKSSTHIFTAIYQTWELNQGIC